MEKPSSTLALNGLSIMLLRLISKHSTPVLEAGLKGSLRVLYNADEFEAALSVLKDRGYIEIVAETNVRLAEPGKEFLDIFDLYQHEEVIKGHIIYVILKFLTELNDSVNTSGFPKIIIDNVPQKYYGGSEENLTHFFEFDREMKNYVEVSRDQRFKINTAGKSRYRIETEQRKKSISFDEYCGIVLSELATESNFVSTILEEHGPVDQKLVRAIESDLATKGFIVLTNTGAYITGPGRAYSARLKLSSPSSDAPVFNYTHIETHGANSPVASSAALTIGNIESRNTTNMPVEKNDPDQRRSLSISRQTLIWTIIGVIVAAIIGFLSLRH